MCSLDYTTLHFSIYSTVPTVEGLQFYAWFETQEHDQVLCLTMGGT